MVQGRVRLGIERNGGNERWEINEAAKLNIRARRCLAEERRAAGREQMGMRSGRGEREMEGRVSLRAVVQIVCRSLDVCSCDSHINCSERSSFADRRWGSSRWARRIPAFLVLVF